MNVCSISLKLINGLWKSIVISLAGFLILTGFMVHSINSEKEKIPVLFINEDDDTILTREFQHYLGRYVAFVKNDMADESQVETALFYDKVKCIIRIPKGFTTNYTDRKPLMINRNMLLHTADSVVVDALIGKYLAILRQCQEQGMSLTKSVQMLERKTAVKTDIITLKERQEKRELFAVYANYMIYALISIIAFFTVNVCVYFRQAGIEMHHKVMPGNANSVYRQIIGVCIFAGIILALFLMMSGTLITGIRISEPHFILIMINVLVFVVFCVSFASFIGMLVHFIKRFDVWGGIVAVVMCFLSGVFVQQDALSPEITNFAKFLPSYLYVKINNDWVNPDGITGRAFRAFLLNEGIILCIALIFALIALIIGEKKINMDL